MNRKTLTALIAAWVWMASFATMTMADSVSLRNGDQLTGRVVTVGDGKLVFHSDVTDSDIEIPWDAVVSLQTEQAVAIQMSDGRQVMARLNVPAAGDARITTAAGDEESVDRNGFQVMGEEQAKEVSPWSGSLRLDFSTTQGNSNTATLGTSARVQHETEKTVLAGYFTSFFQRSDGDRNAENYSWGVRADYKFTERAYGYGSADWLTDSFRSLNLRSQIGVGGGYKFVDEEDIDFAGELGLTYTIDDFKEPTARERTADPTLKTSDDEYLSARLAETVNWKMNDSVQLRHFAEYLPSVEDPFNDYLLRAILEFRVALDKNLYLELGAEDRYDNSPPKGIKRNDLRFYAAIGYTF